jgi:ankyrin repeat protein/tetratricopeptide (TPR) repeat protein
MKQELETAPLSRRRHLVRSHPIPVAMHKLRLAGFNQAVVFVCLLGFHSMADAAEPNPAIPAAATSTNTAVNDPLQMLFRRALVEEESSGNLGEAIQDYQQLLAHLDARRELHATVLFRLGECYRKQGLTNEAVAQYERILREFADQGSLLTLSRQNLAALGHGAQARAATEFSDAGRETQRRLLQEALGLAERQVEANRRRFEGGRMQPDDLVPAQREVFRLRRELASLNTGPNANAEIKRLFEEEKKLVAGMLHNRRLAVEVGAAAQEDLWAVQRELLEIERRIAALGVESPAVPTVHGSSAPALLPDEEREIQRLRALMRNSPDLVNAPGEDGETPLTSAATVGRLGVVRFLLENGAEPQPKALFNATLNGHRAVVELLLERGAEVDAREAGSQRTALHFAAERGFKAVSEALLEHETAIGARDVHGATPLHHASAEGHLSVIDMLLSHGAELNAADQGRATPLVYAIARHQLAAARRLVEMKADIEFPSSHTRREPTVFYQGTFPLHIAVLNGDPAMAELLLKAGANPDVPTRPADNSPGQTSLYFAVRDNRPELASLLIDYGARGDRAGTEGLLCEAVIRLDGTNILKRLIDAGANVNATLANGETPLHYAVAGNKPEILALLVEHGANVNAARDHNGWTPLHYAVEAARPGLAELLLRKGADPNVRASGGSTPLDLLKSKPRSAENQAIAALLREHGAVEDLPRLDRIEVGRASRDYRKVVFDRPTGELHQRTCTLFELLAVQYGLLSGPPGTPAGRDQGRVIHPRPNLRIRTGLPSLAFPDFARVVIRRATADGKGWREIPVNLTEAFEFRECLNDIELHWGDVVEIPELDHPINEEWKGLSDDVHATLLKCLSRRVTIVIKGTETTVTLAPDIVLDERTGQVLQITSQKSFLLLPVLHESKLLLASSDMSRVRVTRTNPVTGGKEVLTLDCSDKNQPPDFWLRDGDYIEVPEKGG